MKKQKIDHKSGLELNRIEDLLDKVVGVNQQVEPPFTPEVCTNECMLRQKGFCMRKLAIAPKYGEACIYKERG